LQLKLILLFFWASSLYAGEDFAFSKPWLNLLHYKKGFFGYKSRAKRPEFFLSSEGMTNPKDELVKTLEAFNRDPDLACRFPARHKLLRAQTKLVERGACPELDKWLKGIDAGDLYLVYSSAYPSNPASLFGHTFLRFDRKKYSDSKVSSKLLGYSLAFQAQTNSDDNSFIYTFKGMTGGYDSYLEIKPHYMDIGAYNNSESRDLWEYKIPISKEEKELMLLHVWELITGTTFSYYFLDENCSTHVLALLEAVKPEWDFSSKSDLFVVPQTTLIEVLEKSEHREVGFRPAIKRLIWARVNRMDKGELSRVFAAKEDVNQISKLKTADEFDLLIDLWKFDNYKAGTKLDASSKEKMDKVLFARANLEEAPIAIDLKNENQERAPDLAHKFKKLGVGYLETPYVEFSYGFHSFDDPILGYDEKSYIKFLEGMIFYEEKEFELRRFDLIKITSLQNFSFSYPHFSWEVNLFANQERREEKLPKKISLSGGIGFSLLRSSWQLFFIPEAKGSIDTGTGKKKIEALLKLSFKKSLTKKFQFVFESEYLPSKSSDKEVLLGPKFNLSLGSQVVLEVGGEYLSTEKKMRPRAQLHAYF